ncbi:MAG: phospholipase D family protein [Halieaceae bacterium]
MKKSFMQASSVIFLAVLVGVACSSLPSDLEQGEASYAVEPAASGPLAELSLDCEQKVTEEQSCFLLLDDNFEDLQWRLALIDSAQHSIDIQTFIWARDFSGRLLISRLFEAAERGVRVRLLVDDFPTRGRDRQIAALDQHPNIEIRLWNPGNQRRIGRNLSFLANLQELNLRLHNKVMIADNRIAISGGRNIANAYFGLMERYNFFDLDLVAIGPVVPPTSTMFDRYWNSPQAVPGVNFHRSAGVEDLPAIRDELTQRLANSPLHQVVAIEAQNWKALLEAGVDNMVPGKAEVIYDKPGEREPSQDALIGLQRFFRQAQHEVLVLNPYLVPGEPFFAEAQALEERGVDMAIMTNSLGSTNQPIVHDAYASTRIPMLEAGVDVYEMKYHPAMRNELDTPPVESDFVSLHAKAAVLDGEHVFIGSFNFSPRSRNLNTEMGILVHSPEFGEQVAEVMRRAMAADNAWQLQMNDTGELSWESADGTLTSQPSQSFWRRFQNGIFSLFPVEQHL